MTRRSALMAWILGASVFGLPTGRATLAAATIACAVLPMAGCARRATYRYVGPPDKFQQDSYQCQREAASVVAPVVRPESLTGSEKLMLFGGALQGGADAARAHQEVGRAVFYRECMRTRGWERVRE